MNIRITTNKREKHIFGEMAYNHFMGEVDGNEEEHFISAVGVSCI
jgi:hypothetical protein